MKNIKSLTLAFVALAGLASQPAHALKAGDHVLGIGLASINPDASTGRLTSTGAQPYATAFQAQTTAASADVSSELTASVSWLYMYSDRFGVEATLGLPPKHTIDLATPNGTAPVHPAAAEVTQYSPAVVAKYFFNETADKVRPYLGLGLAHVSFHSIKINRSDATVAAIAGTSVDMSSSFVPIYNAGVVYEFNDRWSLNASVSYLPIKTTATFVGTGVTTKGDLDLNTIDYVVRIGYRF